MVTKTTTGKVSTILGKEVPTIEFPYSWEEFENPAELATAGEELTPKEQLEVRNGQRERNSLSAARQTAIAPHVKRISETPEYKRQNTLDTMIKNGVPREQAEIFVSGISF